MVATVADVETSQWRALNVFRFVVLAEALTANLLQWRDVARPIAAGAVLIGMVVWTLLAPAAYRRARLAGRSRLDAVLVLDILVAASTLVLTPAVQGSLLVERHAFTLGSFWVAAAMLAASLAHGWQGGVLAAAGLSALDVSLRATITGSTLTNVFLLCLAGAIIGYLAREIRNVAASRELAVEAAAAAAERERLGRAVHDGVLQVLALIQRRGNELGGEAAELGRLAGEQESALRALVRTTPAAASAPAVAAGATRPARSAGANDLLDLVPLLEPLATPLIEVSLPGAPVPLPRASALELAAAVKEALGNVSRHCPPGTRAWVLVEDLVDSVVVTVRDDGPGIAPSRLEEAVADGRIGVAVSIRGRLDALDGRARLMTGPHGTEWELQVPARLPAR